MKETRFRHRAGLASLSLFMGLGLIACGSPPAEGDSLRVDGQNNAVGTTGQAKPTASAFSREKQTDDLSFAYSFPADAAAIVPLDKWLRADQAAMLKEAGAMAAQDRAEAKGNGYPFRQHYFSRSWQVTANTQRFLSLLGATETFTGGAHGNRGYKTLIWDRSNEELVDFYDIFSSRDAFVAATRSDYCEELNRMREEKRGSPVPQDGNDFLNGCPNYDELNILPFSGNGKVIDRILFMAGPYVAGPWAEGDYEISLPVTEAVRSAIEPSYRADF